MYSLFVLGGDIDDAMSTTNTDVTLPPMSAFSSRMGKIANHNKGEEEFVFNLLFSLIIP